MLWQVFYTADSNMKMHEFVQLVTYYLSTIVELAAATVIGIALLQFMVHYVANFRHHDVELHNQTTRIKFGSALTLALELLLAADILATAIAPSWDAIGKLAAIAVLRTSLNYFLERELKQNNLPGSKKAINE